MRDLFFSSSSLAQKYSIYAKKMKPCQNSSCFGNLSIVTETLCRHFAKDVTLAENGLISTG